MSVGFSLTRINCLLKSATFVHWLGSYACQTDLPERFSMPDIGTRRLPPHTQHHLAWLDELVFKVFRETGRSQLMQIIWVYDREVDFAELMRSSIGIANQPFINRLIEPSPVPWGRSRWVKPTSGPVEIEQNPQILPRSQFLSWANQQLRPPIDPVTGPPWRLTFQRFDDGTSAFSMVLSHLIIDGSFKGFYFAAADEFQRNLSPYLPKGRRSWLIGCLSDSWQTLVEVPQAFTALTKISKANWRMFAASLQGLYLAPPNTNVQRQMPLELPAVAVIIKAEMWEACERRLGGSGGLNALLVGFVVTLASYLGRTRCSDGAVNLVIPISKRCGPNDGRAQAIEPRMMTVAPAGLSTSLRTLNIQIKEVIRSSRESHIDRFISFLPGMAWLPKSFALALMDQFFDYAEKLPVSCSNQGVLPEIFGRIDGSRCAYILNRGADVNVTRCDLERTQGHLVVVACRYNDTITLCIEACQLDPLTTTNDELRLMILRTLSDFSLDAVVEA
jgi:hypothetical protein